MRVASYRRKMKSLKETNVTECACCNAEYLLIDTKNNCKKVFEYGGGYEYGRGVPCHDSSITESIMINQIYLYGLGYSRQPSTQPEINQLITRDNPQLNQRSTS